MWPYRRVAAGASASHKLTAVRSDVSFNGGSEARGKEGAPSSGGMAGGVGGTGGGGSSRKGPSTQVPSAASRSYVFWRSASSISSRKVPRSAACA